MCFNQEPHTLGAAAAISSSSAVLQLFSGLKGCEHTAGVSIKSRNVNESRLAVKKKKKRQQIMTEMFCFSSKCYLMPRGADWGGGVGEQQGVARVMSDSARLLLGRGLCFSLLGFFPLADF